jgi:transposase
MAEDSYQDHGMEYAATFPGMRTSLVSDDLWDRIAPLLPPEPPKPKGGRLRIPDRAALTGIIFLLKTGTSWEMLPAEFDSGSGMACWRRQRDRQEADG